MENYLVCTFHGHVVLKDSKSRQLTREHLYKRAKKHLDLWEMTLSPSLFFSLSHTHTATHTSQDVSDQCSCWARLLLQSQASSDKAAAAVLLQQLLRTGPTPPPKIMACLHPNRTALKGEMGIQSCQRRCLRQQLTNKAQYRPAEPLDKLYFPRVN